MLPVKFYGKIEQIQGNRAMMSCRNWRKLRMMRSLRSHQMNSISIVDFIYKILRFYNWVLSSSSFDWFLVLTALGVDFFFATHAIELHILWTNGIFTLQIWIKVNALCVVGSLQLHARVQQQPSCHINHINKYFQHRLQTLNKMLCSSSYGSFFYRCQ